MQTKETIHAIRKALDALTIDTSKRNTERTQAIKTALCTIGSKLNVWVYASGCDAADGGEYLYDVTWLEYEEEFLTDAALVVECEWSNLSHIDEDFQKLLLARAGIRLMIFDGSHPPYSQEFVQHLARQIRSFRRSSNDDAWLFAAWEVDEGMKKGWRFRCFTLDRGTVCEL